MVWTLSLFLICLLEAENCGWSNKESPLLFSLEFVIPLSLALGTTLQTLVMFWALDKEVIHNRSQTIYLPELTLCIYTPVHNKFSDPANTQQLHKVCFLVQSLCNTSSQDFDCFLGSKVQENIYNQKKFSIDDFNWCKEIFIFIFPLIDIFLSRFIFWFFISMWVYFDCLWEHEHTHEG